MHFFYLKGILLCPMFSLILQTLIYHFLLFFSVFDLFVVNEEFMNVIHAIVLHCFAYFNSVGEIYCDWLFICVLYFCFEDLDINCSSCISQVCLKHYIKCLPFTFGLKQVFFILWCSIW